MGNTALVLVQPAIKMIQTARQQKLTVEAQAIRRTQATQARKGLVKDQEGWGKSQFCTSFHPEQVISIDNNKSNY